MTTAQDNKSANLSSAARAEAAAWIARLHGPQRSASLEAGFRRWLGSAPQNARAFEGMTEIWDAVAGTSAGRFPRVSWERGRYLGSQRWRRRFAVAAAIAFTVGLAGFTAYGILRDPAYATAVGEQRTIDLKDGSRVTLNSNTRLIVRYSEISRRIGLDRGEALFEVASDTRRPFVVTAGDHKVTALGTTFIVRHEIDSTAVTLMEGKVTVAPIARAEGAAGGSERDTTPQKTSASITLAPGQRFTVSARRTEQVDNPPVEALTAWRRGEVVLDHTPLADAVAEMNRYDATAIVIEDSRTAAVRISGNYRTGDANGFARAVAAMYGLEMTRRGGRIYLRGPSP